jgi:hypothetical protein
LLQVNSPDAGWTGHGLTMVKAGVRIV